MGSEREQLEAGIAALEAQRAQLGDAVVDASLAGLRAKLAALAAPPPSKPAQTLKQVTILFLDVVGSKSLSQTLDPEEIHAVMDGALARGSRIVEAHYGKVLQYAGDNLLAVFGANEVQEDDAERAVRCGLALLELGRTLGADVQAAHGHAGFNVRVGMHTGGVLLGGGVDAEGTIRGIAVNISARMEQTAPPGGLRISHDTYAQVRGLFEVQVQEPLAVKGVDAPVQSYLVQRAKPRSFRIGTRGIEGVATRMVGRNAELEALQAAFERLFQERRLAAVTVVAEAGIGKSRLLYEFEAWSETRPESFFLFRGRANAQTQSQPFGLLRDLLTWRLQIADDDSIEAARAKMEQVIVPLFVRDDGADLAEGHAHLLGHLIGIEWRGSRHIRGILEDPKQIRSRALHTAAQIFRRVSASDGSPIVVQLENLHWADNESLDFLSYLGDVDRDVPMLILASSRPTLFERRDDWLGVGTQHRRIDLSPLDKGASRELANELLKKLPEIPAALRELLTGGAEGNPFYMEELLRMLIDQGAIDTGSAERWVLHADKLLATRVPGTLTGVLQARLDGLPAQEKATLQEASVIGQVFWDQALFALDAQAKDALPSLVGRELAVPRTDAIKDMGSDELREYAFRHHILHQVTYSTVLKRHKRELHAKVAHWLSGLGGVRANDFLGIVAEHYEKAGDAANAAEYHVRAAEHAGSRFAHGAALAQVDRALLLLDRTASVDSTALSLRWRLLQVRETSLDLQGRTRERRVSLDALWSLADTLDNDHRRAYAALRNGDLAMRIADWPACEHAARKSIAFAERAGDHALRLAGQRELALALAFQGDPASGKALAQQGLTEARERALRSHEAKFLSALSVIVGDQLHDLMGSLELDRQTQVIEHDIGNLRNEAIALANIGTCWMNLGDLVQARHDLEEALRLVRGYGDHVPECVILSNLSRLVLWQGDDAHALGMARQALEASLALESRDQEVITLFNLGNAELALGRHAAAFQAYEQSRGRALEIGSAWQHDAAAGLVRVALATGETVAAMQHVETLLDNRARGGTLDGTELPTLIELTCHRALARAGDSRALEWLVRAYESLQAQAANIPDAALRQGFLRNIPHHREIVAAWAVRPHEAMGDDEER